MKKTIALLLAIVMVMSMFVGCSKTPDDTNDGAVTDNGAVDNTDETNEPADNNDQPDDTAEPAGPATYTYQDSVTTMATNWNPHTYQTNDDAYPSDTGRIRIGLYDIIFNDELHPVEGKDPFTGYVVVPEMAASEPVDVTEQVKAEHPEFNIPESATSGYAYTIDLNPNATWEDGTPINADTYVYSMQRLLDPSLLNYRAADYYAQQLCIAGAEAYANGGQTAWADSLGAYAVEDLVKGDDGYYYTADGKAVGLGLAVALDWTGGDTLQDYVDAYGDAYFDVTNWETLVGMMDSKGVVRMNDETLALFTPVICGNEAWGETEADLPNYFVIGTDYPVVEYEGTVGLYKSGDYQITMVLGKSLAGFNLLYSLTSNWIVYEPYYEACLSESNGVWTSTYNTSVETTMSYGPYKMTEYQTDKFMKFEKNENWYGWTDGNHQYVDPTDGQTYDMYQTDIIECEVVAEAATCKLMFLKGELMGYGLQAEDFATYRNSDYIYFTPAETIFFLILNGYKDAIQSREAAADFDQAAYDLETLTLKTFKQAMAVTYDKELFCATISPARSGAYGIIGSSYVYDVDTGSMYRDTDQAKQVLCDFYNVDVSQYDSLDEAVDSITGYDPEAAKELFAQAFQESLDAGFITDNDGDGISDQTIQIEYALSADSDFMTKTLDYLNAKVAEVTVGTPFDGKIVFVKSAPYGNDWSNKIKSGLADTVLAGWSGSVLDPFGLSDLYVNPDYQYDAAWFNAETVNLTLTINGEEITMNLRQWSDALNGATVTVNDKEYCFGDGIADIETRLTILAAIEGEILQTYDYIPMMQNASAALLSQQVYYVVEEYNPICGRGGIQYLKYNYNDAEWAAYVAENGGELQY